MWLAARHPWSVLLLLACVTAAALFRIEELRFEVSAESLMVEKGPARDFYRRVLERFGSDEVSIVFLRDKDLFAPEKLLAIRSVLEGIDLLPFVERTESLFSVSHLRSTAGYVSWTPYLKEIPATPEEAEAVRAAALRNPFVAGNLLSADGTAMAINIYLKPVEDSTGYDRRLTEAFDHLLAPLAGMLETVFQIGSPYIRQAISERILRDQQILLPASILVLFTTLALGLRRVGGVLIPFLTTGLSVVWTLGLMAALHIAVNVMTSIIPVLLIVIGSTANIHLLAEYYAAAPGDAGRPAAIRRMAASMGTAVLLTFLTTYLGFLSVALNDVALIRQFGLLASTGLLLNFVITVLAVPAILQIAGKAPSGNRRASTSHVLGGLAQRIVPVLQSRRLTVALGTGLVLIVFGYGAFSLQINNTPLDYFAAGSPVIQRVRALEERLAGMETFSIVLRSGIEGTFLKPRYLQEIQRLQAFLGRTGRIDKSMSFADYVALINAAMEERDTAEPVLPESDAIVQEYMSLIGHAPVRALVSPDYSETRVLVRHAAGSSLELERTLAAIRAFARDQLDPALDLRITGESVLTAGAARSIAAGQVQSLGLMILAIFVLIALLFVNAKAGLIAVAPNLVPVVILFGVMGYAGVSLDTGTAMIAAIALGISVDHTIHFMVRYHHLMQERLDELPALIDTLRNELLPMFASGAALALGFATLALSGFPPVVDFGLLSALVMVLAVASTSVITPALLSSIRLITLWDLLSLSIRQRFVEKSPLFKGLRPWQIKKIVLISKLQEFRHGEPIIRQGEAGEEMYVLLEGSAEVRATRADGSQEKLRRLATGDLFGEVALVSRVPRTADVVALEDCRVLAYRWEGLERIARIFPRIATRLFRNLAAVLGRRLAEMHPHRESGGAP